MIDELHRNALREIGSGFSGHVQSGQFLASFFTFMLAPSLLPILLLWLMYATCCTLRSGGSKVLDMTPLPTIKLTPKRRMVAKQRDGNGLLANGQTNNFKCIYFSLLKSSRWFGRNRHFHHLIPRDREPER